MSEVDPYESYNPNNGYDGYDRYDGYDGYDGYDQHDSSAPRKRQRHNRSQGDSQAQQLQVQPADTLSTVAQAVIEAMQKQVTRAIDVRAEPNKPVDGDANARIAFLTLLPNVLQRSVFLAIAPDHASWPRLRTLFGAPPYAFLRPEDTDMIRAAGIAPGRSNMGYDNSERAAIANYSQFGTPHALDEQGRQYRLVQDNVDPSVATPGIQSIANAPGSGPSVLAFQIRIARHTRAASRNPQSHGAPSSVSSLGASSDALDLSTRRPARIYTFPMIGEPLLLTESEQMRRLCSRSQILSVNVVVQRLVRRDASASTAVVICRLGQ